MAEELRADHFRTPTRDSVQVDKENITPDVKMKTSTKLTGLSPFVKNGSKGFKIMSDEEIALSSSKKKQFSNTKGSQKRRSLATLQPCSDGKGKLAGNGRECLSIKEAFKRKKDIQHSSNLTKIDIKASVFDDANVTVVKNNSVSQSVVEEKSDDEFLVNEALQLMKETEKADDSYWQELAEERRDALEETLKENEKLYDEIDKLTDEKDKLKKQLSDAECYKILYNNLLASQDENVAEEAKTTIS